MKVLNFLSAAFAAALILAGCGQEEVPVSQKKILQDRFAKKYSTVLSISQTQALLGYGKASDAQAAMEILKTKGFDKQAKQELDAIDKAH